MGALVGLGLMGWKLWGAVGGAGFRRVGPWDSAAQFMYLQTRKLRRIEVKLLAPYGVQILSPLLLAPSFFIYKMEAIVLIVRIR